MKKLLIYACLLIFSVTAIAGNGGDGKFRSYDLVKACQKRVDPNIIYDGRYYQMKYPMGDVPADRGVCTDAVIRVLRDVGFDLQKHVHMDIVQDIRDNASKIYHITKANSSIDHRRVWNLKKYFDGWAMACASFMRNHNGDCNRPCIIGVPVTGEDGKGYFKPGTIIIYEMWKGQGHIGIVIDSDKNLLYHQVGYGQVIDESLRDWKIVGAYYIDKPSLELFDHL